MENKEIFVPCDGDTIANKEVVTFEQMRSELLDERLLHIFPEEKEQNPEMNKDEMNKEMKKKWNNEEDFQKYMHEKYCIWLGVPMCKQCFKKLMEERANVSDNSI